MAEPKSNVVDIEEQRMMQRNEQEATLDQIIPQTQSTSVSRQYASPESFVQNIIRSLNDNLTKIQSDNVGIIRINFLPNKNLKAPIEAVVERDGELFIARSVEIPLYGQGEDVVEAVDALKYELESLYDDLMEDDDFTDEWLRIKEFLKTRIAD